MPFELKNFFFPLFIFIAIEVLIFILMPLEMQSDMLMFNYDTGENEKMKVISYAPILLLNIVVAGLILYFALPKDEKEKSIIRSLRTILHDKNVSPYCSLFNFKPNSKILDQRMLGDTQFGTIFQGLIENIYKEQILITAIAHDNYDTTDVRQRAECPILDATYYVGDLQAASREHKPSIRAPKERMIQRVMKLAKEDSTLRQKAEAIEEEEQGEE